MNVEEILRRCTAQVGQIARFDPEPYYVRHAFQSYLDMINAVYAGILEEADRDFGLFAARHTVEGLRERCNQKNDAAAAEFVSWYEELLAGEHKSHYPAFMRSMTVWYGLGRTLPDAKIMLRAEDRHTHDIHLDLPSMPRNGKIPREQLQVEINRQAPTFLMLINRKRSANGEPAVPRHGIVASAFFEGFEDFEISHASEVYVPVMRRIISDARERIKELTGRS